MPALPPLLVGALVSAALSGVTYALQAVLAPTLKKPILSGRIDNLRSIRKDNTAPLRIVYGRYRASGVLLFARSVDRDGQFRAGGPFLHGALAMAHGPIADIGEIQLNDKPADSGEFAHLAAFAPFMGLPDQPMFRGPMQISVFPRPGDTFVLDQVCQLPTEWLDAYRPLRELAYLWFMLRHDPDVFRGGAPNIRATMQGRLVYDPRDNSQHDTDPSTWRWSENPALCIRDFWTSRVYGFGIPQGMVDDDDITAAADTCETLLDAPSDRQDPADAMPQIARYTCNGLFETDELPLDVLGKLLQCCAASTLVHSRKFHLRVGEPTVSASDVTTGRVITLTPNDLRSDEPLQVFQLPGRDSRVNTVRGTYVNPAKGYVPDEFPVVTAEAYLEQDGNLELPAQLQLDFVNHPDRAQYIGAIYLRRARLGKTTWPVTPAKAAQLLPLSRIRLLHPHLGWGFTGTVTVTGASKTYAGTGIGLGLGAIDIGQQITVHGCAIAGNNGSKTLVTVSDNAITVSESCTDEGPTLEVEVGGKDAQIRNWDRLPNGAINLQLEEYTHATFDQYLNPATQPDPTNLPDAFQLEPPTSVAAVEETQVNPDGTRVSKLVVTWAAPTAGLFDGFEVRWRRIAPTEGPIESPRRVPAPATRYDIPNLAQGVYLVQVGSTLNTKLRLAPSIQAEVTYRTAPPPAPIDVRIAQYPGSGVRRLTWRYETRPPDLFGTEVRWLPGSASETEASWAAATFIRQTRDDALEVSAPTAPGQYTYLLRAVDTTGLYSNIIASVLIDLVPSAPDMLLERSFSEAGWPIGQHGHIAGGRVNTDGHLEGQGELIWEEAADPSWEDLEEFNSGGGTVIYTTDIEDLGADRAFVVSPRYHARGADNVAVLIRTRRDADTVWSPWKFIPAGFGRYVQFRIRAYASTTAPTIEQFGVALRAALTDDLRGDLPMTGTSGDLVRVEHTMGDWNGGPWQVNVEAVRSGDGLAFMRPDPETSFELDGATYITAPDHPLTRLQQGAFTLELVLRVGTLAHATCIIVGKGDGWQILYGNGVFQLVCNGSIVPGSQITITDAVPIYHLAYSFRFGRLFKVLNGLLVGTVDPGPLLLATDTSPLRIGAYSDGSLKFTGIVEDVRVWRIGRSVEDISRDAGAHVDPNANGLVAYYRCDDRSGSAVRDHSTLENHASVVGTPVWVRMAYRESPPIPLAILPRWRAGRAQQVSVTPSGTTCAVQVSSNGTTWSTVIPVLSTPIPSMTVGEDPAGKTLRMRTFLKATTIANSPTVHSLQVSLGYTRGTGDLVVQPSIRFAELLQATIQAIQDPAVRAGWDLVRRDAAGVRFRVYEAGTGVPQDALVDVALRGVALEA